MSISSEISRLTQAKADIKTAIENKGVTVPGSAKLDDYPDFIDDIEQGSTPNLQSKSVSIIENGTTTVAPDPGFDGLSEVGVSVNVQGGGGGSSWELLATKEYKITEDPDPFIQIGEFQLNETDIYRSDRIILGMARKRNYSHKPTTHLGTDSFVVNKFQKNSETQAITMSNGRVLWNYYIDSSGKYGLSMSGLNTRSGVYIEKIESPSNGKCNVIIAARYISSFGSTIGNYDFYVYSLPWPNNQFPYK